MADILRTLGRITGSSTANPYITQMWWLPATPGGSTADATDCLDRFRDMWVALMAKVTNSLVIDFDPLCITVDDSTGNLEGAFAATPVASVSGTGGTSPLPLQTQGLIRWNTAQIRGGRFVRGRTFVPAPDEADNSGASGGAPGGSYMSQLGFGVTALLAAGATASAPIVWGRPRSPGASDGVSALITSGVGQPRWSVQRSRR